MIVTGCIWAALAWGASTDVEIEKPSGAVETVTVGVDCEYEEFRYEGEEMSGCSLKSVLKQVGVGDRAWTSIKLEGLTVQNGSFEPKKPPIFYIKTSNQTVTFYKPKTKDDPAVTKQASGAVFDMAYRVPLEVDASDNSPEAGQTVTYTASVPGGGRQSAYEFTWTPSSGEGGTGPKFKYTYPESSGEVTINVTAKRGSDNTTVGSSTTSTSVKAPPQESGGTGGSSGGSSGFGGSGGFDSGYTPPSSNFDIPNSPSTPNFPDRSDFPEPPKVPDGDQTPLEEPGISVEGELLSAVATLPPASGDAAPESAAEADARDPQTAIEEAKEISAPGALIAGGIVVGLLGLGAGREMENVRPRRIRRPDLSGLRRLSPPWK